MLFDIKGNIRFISQFEFKQYFPRNGWVEHNPNEIWLTTLKALKHVIKKAKSLKNIEGIIVGKAIYDGDIKLEDLATEIN